MIIENKTRKKGKHELSVIKMKIIGNYKVII